MYCALQCGLLFLIYCTKVNGEIHGDSLAGGSFSNSGENFSLWPSLHNGIKLVSVKKREVNLTEVLHSEAGSIMKDNNINNKTVEEPVDKKETIIEPNKPVAKIDKENRKVPVVNKDSNKNTTNSSVIAETSKVNDTATANLNPLSNPGVLKRGFIVFGGFAIMAVAYFIFYRQKNKKNNANNGNNDLNQFRYGVLQSEDTRDKMELSRRPFIMESEDEDEEDLEIFDLGQKKKSLSYVNLQTNDEDIVLAGRNEEEDKDNLLLDIDDNDTLINWSSNANNNKSIL